MSIAVGCHRVANIIYYIEFSNILNYNAFAKCRYSIKVLTLMKVLELLESVDLWKLCSYHSIFQHSQGILLSGSILTGRAVRSIRNLMMTDILNQVRYNLVDSTRVLTTKGRENPKQMWNMSQYQEKANAHFSKLGLCTNQMYNGSETGIVELESYP